MSQLVVRVGASVDRSVASAFKSVIDAARAAERTTSAVSAKSTAVAKSEAGKQADAHVKATEKWMATRQRIMQNSATMAARVAAKEVSDAQRAEEKKSSAFDRAEALRTRIAERENNKREAVERRQSRAIEREIDKRARAAELLSKKNTAKSAYDRTRGIDSGLSTGFGYAAGAAGRAIGFTKDVAMDLARGAGVNTDLGTAFAANTSLQSQAVDVSNSGYIAGDKRNGNRVASGDLVREARQVGTDTAFDPSQVLGGLQAFAGKTGDLQTGRDIMKDLAVLSKATGTNLEDMVSASGDVSNALGEIPDKGAAVTRVMQSFAGQSKLGAVEIKDLAVQMAKVAASAGKFEGSSELNLAILGGFAQEARQNGGRATATQAAQATMGFADTFGKNARFEAFKAEGIDVNSKTQSGKYRDPREIIIDALQKTGGNQQRMNKMFASTTAQGVTGGFMKVFNEEKDRTKGTEEEKLAAATIAVRQEMDRLTLAGMGQGEIMDSFNAAMKTSSAKAQVFNNKLGKLAEDLQTSAIPALERLGPPLLQLVPAITALVPPFLALATKLANYVADVTGASGNAEESDAVNADVKAFNSSITLGRGIRGGKVAQSDIDTGKEDLAALDVAIANKKKKVDDEQKQKPLYVEDREFGGYGTAENEARAARNKTDEKQLADMVKDRNALNSRIEALLGGTLKVEITNLPKSTPAAPGGPTLKKPDASK